MAKTHHRRRHRRANRSRRGGMMKASSSGAAAAPAAAAPAALAPAAAAPAAAAPAASAADKIDMEAIKRRVMALAAEKPEQPIKTGKKGISKKQASRKHFQKILAGKATHSTSKSPFRHDSGTSDSHAAHHRGY